MNQSGNVEEKHLTRYSSSEISYRVRRRLGGVVLSGVLTSIFYGENDSHNSYLRVRMCIT